MVLPGKHICEILKDVRKQIADANDIDYTPGECLHDGFCLGTCPMCEMEKNYLEQQISLKQKAGKVIKIVGIASGLVALTAQPISAQTPEAFPENAVMNWDLNFFNFNGGPFPENEEMLDELAEFIEANPDELYIVIGKTDSRGNENYNLKLSQRRAYYICQMLKSRIGDRPLRLVPVAVGFYEPSIPNAQDEAEHEQNRKVTVETYDPHRHSGKVAALIEYAVCKELGISLPKKLEKRCADLQLPYDEDTMKAKFDKLAEDLRELRRR